MRRIDLEFEKLVMAFGDLMRWRIIRQHKHKSVDYSKVQFISYFRRRPQSYTDPGTMEDTWIEGILVQVICIEQEGLQYLDTPDAYSLDGKDWYDINYQYTNRPHLRDRHIRYDEEMLNKQYASVSFLTECPLGDTSTSTLLDNMAGLLFSKTTGNTDIMRRVLDRRYGKALVERLEAISMSYALRTNT